MSAKVVVHRAMSLDGFIAGPEHENHWSFEHTAEGAEEMMAATGAMLSGRRPDARADKIPGQHHARREADV